MNPFGGDRSAERRWRSLEPAMARRFPDLTIHRITHPGELTGIAAAIAAHGGPSLVLAAGGDGTSHEVINGLIRGGKVVNPSARLGWVPLGSGNDLARTVGFPSGRENLLRAFDALEPAAMDVGVVHYQDRNGASRTIAFGNSITVGVTTEALRLVRARQAKPLGGRVAYLIAGARAITTHEPRDLAITEDGRRETGPAWLLSVTNGRTFAAGMRIAPDARVDDGVLDTVRITGRSRLVLLSLLPRVYWGGHRSHRGVRTSRARSVVIDAQGPIDFEADGELYLARAPLSIAINPLALPILRPATGDEGERS